LRERVIDLDTSTSRTESGWHAPRKWGEQHGATNQLVVPPHTHQPRRVDSRRPL